jgi:hypothetical protein
MRELEGWMNQRDQWPVTVGSLGKWTFSALPAGGEPGVNTFILTEMSEQTLRSSGAKLTDRRSTDGCGEAGSTCTTDTCYFLLLMSMAQVSPNYGLLQACCSSPRWHERLQNHGGMILTGENRRTRRKSCLTATLSITTQTWTDPGANPGKRGERSAINRLKHSRALLSYLQSCSVFYTTEVSTKIVSWVLQPGRICSFADFSRPVCCVLVLPF